MMLGSKNREWERKGSKINIRVGLRERPREKRENTEEEMERGTENDTWK